MAQPHDPKPIEERTWVMLGIHVPPFVDKPAVRVRMFVGPQRRVIDEDFDVPKLPAHWPTVEENIVPFMESVIDARVAELAKGAQPREGAAVHG